jgi:hypothetical protein
MKAKTKAVKAKPRKRVWYKVLGLDGRSCNGGHARWPLPKHGRPGAWMPLIEQPFICARGYHLVPKKGLAEWLNYWGPCLVCIAEPRGKVHPSPADLRYEPDFLGTHDGKRAFAQARILKVVGMVPPNVAGPGRRNPNDILREARANPYRKRLI